MFKTEAIKGFIRKEDGKLKLNYDDIYTIINFIKFLTKEAETGEDKNYVYNEIMELVRIGLFN